MRRWNASEKTILALIVGSAAFNACSSQNVPEDTTYLKIAAAEALAHQSGATRVTIRAPEHSQSRVGFVGYGSRMNGEFSSRVNYLTRDNNIVSESLDGVVQGRRLDIELPGDRRMIGDREGFYHIVSRDGDRKGHLRFEFTERDGELYMQGEYCPLRSACREVLGTRHLDNEFTVTFAALPGGNAEQITGEMYNR